MSYHNNTDIGLTVWNSEEQAYYLIPFANVTAFFKATTEKITVPYDLVDAAFNFLSTYDPIKEIVLLTLNEDLLTVAVVDKNQSATLEAKAEKLGWSLRKYTAFEYVVDKNIAVDISQQIFELTAAEYDFALGVMYND